MTTPEESPADDALGSRFRVTMSLGSGGEAEVVRAWDRKLGRDVALKLRQMSGATGRIEIEREARTLRRLRPHPNLTRALDDVVVGSTHVLVMDFVDGQDLRAILRLSGRPGLPPQQVLRYLGAIATALEHLHAHEPPVAHGDVKPANIVVSPGRRGRTVLVDLGLAGAEGDVKVEGTGAYSPPEVGIVGRSPAGDVFSLAATAHALLTGYAPEPGVAADWRGLPVGTREAVRAVFARGLSVRPADRPSSAGELVTALRDALREPATGRRRPARALVTAAALLPLLLLGTTPTPLPQSAGRGPDASRRLVPQTPAPGSGPVTAPVPTAVQTGTADGGVSGARPDPVTPTDVRPEHPSTLLTLAGRSGRRIGLLYPRVGILDTVYELLDVSHLDDQGRLVTEGSNYDIRPPGDAVVYVSDDLISEYAAATGELRPVRVLADGGVAFGPSASLQPGFTEILGLGDGWQAFYDGAHGAAVTVRFDEDGNYLASTKHVASLPAGYDAFVRLANRSALLYRSSDGASLLFAVANDGAISSRPGPVLAPGLVAVCDDLNGTVVGIDGAGRATSMRMEHGALRTVATFNTGRPWQQCAPAREALLVFDGANGAVLQLDRRGQPLSQLPFSLPPGASLVYLGPRP